MLMQEIDRRRIIMMAGFGALAAAIPAPTAGAAPIPPAAPAVGAG
ncbi:1,3-beta-glucanase, partial [Mycobacterium ulcerans]